jgi:DNA-directed RNA polymerase specialized sigma24 family protein
MSADGLDSLDGASASDLVQETLLAFFSSRRRPNWNEGQSAIEAFLVGILRHKVIDKQRRAKRLVPLEADDDAVVNERLTTPAVALENMIEEERVAGVLKSAHGDPLLEELVVAARQLEEGKNINQRLAIALNTTPADIVNRKKRIQRRDAEEGRGAWNPEK